MISGNVAETEVVVQLDGAVGGLPTGGYIVCAQIVPLGPFFQVGSSVMTAVQGMCLLAFIYSR